MSHTSAYSRHAIATTPTNTPYFFPLLISPHDNIRRHKTKMHDVKSNLRRWVGCAVEINLVCLFVKVMHQTRECVCRLFYIQSVLHITGHKQQLNACIYKCSFDSTFTIEHLDEWIIHLVLGLLCLGGAQYVEVVVGAKLG